MLQKSQQSHSADKLFDQICFEGEVASWANLAIVTFAQACYFISFEYICFLCDLGQLPKVEVGNYGGQGTPVARQVDVHQTLEYNQTCNSNRQWKMFRIMFRQTR